LLSAFFYFSQIVFAQQVLPSFDLNQPIAQHSGMGMYGHRLHLSFGRETREGKERVNGTERISTESSAPIKLHGLLKGAAWQNSLEVLWNNKIREKLVLSADTDHRNYEQDKMKLGTGFGLNGQISLGLLLGFEETRFERIGTIRTQNGYPTSNQEMSIKKEFVHLSLNYLAFAPFYLGVRLELERQSQTLAPRLNYYRYQLGLGHLTQLLGFPLKTEFYIKQGPEAVAISEARDGGQYLGKYNELGGSLETRSNLSGLMTILGQELLFGLAIKRIEENGISSSQVSTSSEGLAYWVGIKTFSNSTIISLKVENLEQTQGAQVSEFTTTTLSFGLRF
jgi:hypothetical protein